MNEADWMDLLSQWSKEMVECRDIIEHLPKKVIQSNWLGFPGALESQIAQTENRLGIVFPASYRAFLKVTNGWYDAGFHIHKIWSTEEVDWYATKHQDLIDAAVEGERRQTRAAGFNANVRTVPDEQYFIYGADQNTINIRSAYLQTALEISQHDPAGDGVCLLNPKILTPDGEWEAWFFAHWLPGARRYRSFWELMQGEYRMFLQIKSHDYVKKGKRYQPHWWKH